MSTKTAFVVQFKDVTKDDVALVGGKGANLGEMVRAGFPVPNGFIVTSNAYYNFLEQNNLTTKIRHLMGTVNHQKPESLTQVSQHIKEIIMKGEMAPELVHDIVFSYRHLSAAFSDALVAVRSSATAEDLPDASFAGQQETFLNVQGEANLIHAVKKAWASLFEARAIFYREQKHFSHFKIGIAIPVQKMVESEMSGVMFTIDPVTNDKTKIVIEAIFGLGEFIVQGKVTPDHYEVNKSTLEVTEKRINIQERIYKKVGKLNKDLKLPEYLGKKQKISDKQIIALAQYGKSLEKHYFFPQDIEWAIEKNKIYIVQTRPVTTINNKKKEISDKSKTESVINLPLIVKGDGASPGIVSGPARVISSAKEIGKIMPHDVLVAPQTNPDYVPAMKKASAVVTDAGGRTSHAAIVSRELGIPAVVGAKTATAKIKTGQIITVNGSTGEIFKGGVIKTQGAQTVETAHQHVKTATKVYVNLAEPELAGRVSLLDSDGVGLLRAEFMMAGIGVHPKKLLRSGRKKVFIEKLAEDLEEICKAFSPRPVVYRASDFKTNEYRNLVGGKDFEPIEPNPMLGFRGAYRYIHDPDVFDLELEAIKIIRNKKGLKNLWMMVPFVRTVEELRKVKTHITASGLHRSNSFKLWMMVEIPSNVILLDEFIKVGIDGVSIGSNDLTMLILGTDRDNNEVASEFDEQNPAVLWALEKVIKTAHKYKITSSLCGQAASSYPTLVEKLVSWGITSVSVSPDAVEQTRQVILRFEKKLLE